MTNSIQSETSRKPPSSSSSKPTNGKPEKPYAGFPLFAHEGGGQWCKKINKRLVYFGSYRNDPDGTAALERFNREWPYLKENRIPPPVDVSNGCTLRQLCNEFLRAKEDKRRANDLSPRTFKDYYKTCESLINYFGKDRRVDDLRPQDFAKLRSRLAERLGVVSLGNEINRVYILFNFAKKNNLIEKEVSYGQSFDRPSAKTLRRNRNEGGAKLFEREEVLRILDAGDVQMKAMILLGINGGLGNTDIAELPESAVNLKTGWVDFPRPKTEIPRRIPLWTETIAALKAALAVRHTSADESAKGLCFLTRLGKPWVRIKLKEKKAEQTEPKDAEPNPQDYIPIDALSPAFGKLLKKLKINGRRGLGFYSLRHCFETYAGETIHPDQVAVNAIMGHVDSSMAGNYRHGVWDERLKIVVETVRAWLYPTKKEENKEGGEQ